MYENVVCDDGLKTNSTLFLLNLRFAFYFFIVICLLIRLKRYYSVFLGFRDAKSANGGSILSSSQFLILPQLPQKMKLASKVGKVDSKISVSLPKI